MLDHQVVTRQAFTGQDVVNVLELYNVDDIRLYIPTKVLLSPLRQRISDETTVSTHRGDLHAVVAQLDHDRDLLFVI